MGIMEEQRWPSSGGGGWSGGQSSMDLLGWR